mmetsp:Transcript_1925/g.2671  ORF Transcript_1925/g.2671 Transcript_1925/m.2671 type:complete len:291 (-) Transcript_1925:129-1001(-)|eukprot:CAMPEP_0178921812 /NCGR_PEP_ID=MMETSP0786-20121207/15777_1 /TAXON_ID=186022 /ORGANISM="Thalassionema frauenfeldii, Strain CCMP 1798" /LENGTH=290 /DNA_ID=CAMNT_0020596049 /DNA_START=68 /DNA_END=940 /DNA_ORIENTATION=+
MQDYYYYGTLLLLSLICVWLPHDSSIVVESFSWNSAYRQRRLQLCSTTTDEADISSAAQQLTIARPAIHWTVPGFKVGWQDDDGNWFDEDGPRKGPPLNYWRQRIDEREYNRDMDVVNAILSSSENVMSLIRQCEESRSVRRPSLNRKLLGEWGPILHYGTCVASTDDDDDDHNMINVPFRIRVYRTDGPVLGKKTPYGVFDAQLKEGESVTVETSSLQHSFAASESNEPIICGMVQDRPLCFGGGITYITDYILIQRGPEGDIDVWLRLDDGYLGKTNEENEQKDEQNA